MYVRVCACMYVSLYFFIHIAYSIIKDIAKARMQVHAHISVGYTRRIGM